MLARLSVFFTLLASLSLTALGAPTPVVLIDAWPQITEPTAGTICKAGNLCTVSWSQELVAQYNSSQLGQTANFLLYWLEAGSDSFQDGQTIASDVQLYSGKNSLEVKLPATLQTRSTYHIALIGSSSDSSAAFTINAATVGAVPRA